MHLPTVKANPAYLIGINNVETYKKSRLGSPALIRVAVEALRLPYLSTAPLFS